MIKKLIIYFTLLAFLVNSAGYYIIFEISKLYLEKEMRYAILQKKVSIAVLRIDVSKSGTNYHRISNNEFIYNGNLYDIIHEVKVGDTTTFYCASDKKEDGLLDNLHKSILGKIRDIFQDHLIKTAIVDQPAIKNHEEIRNFKFGFQYITYTDYYSGTLSPPPES